MFQITQEIKLKPITQKGKNKIYEAGTNIWYIVSIKDKIPGRSLEGPWLLITPHDRATFDNMSRWIHATHDLDFEVSI